MPFEVKRANKAFNRLLKATLGKYLLRKYRIDCINPINPNLKPPYIILANHVNNWDPFFIGQFVKEPVHYVASDEQFRNPVKRFFFQNLLGIIPKTKFVSDMETVKQIIQLIKKDAVIGIFPEGMRNWDGHTGELLPSTSKLIKMLKLPVIACILEGSYLSHPRWSLYDKIGPISLDFRQVLSPEDLHSMTTEQIHQSLRAALAHDEYQLQYQRQIPYKGKRLAEHLEQFLFICPSCHSIASLRSDMDRFYCQCCSYEVCYTQTGFFSSPAEKVLYKEPQSWNQWQLQFLWDCLKAASNTTEEKILFRDKDAALFTAGRYEPLRKLEEGQLTLSHHFYFIRQDSSILNFELDRIAGLNVQYSNELEFYYDKQLYRFKFKDPRTSAYKWTAALELLQNIYRDPNERRD